MIIVTPNNEQCFFFNLAQKVEKKKMAVFFSIDKKEEQSDISNIDNYELNLDADEIAK